MNTKKIRVGVIGLGRGGSFMRQAEATGMELVAICDTWKTKLKEVGKELKVATYTDYDKFLEHDMDAVITANYFHEHAPFAIKALKAGMHVMSECTACKTMSEAVALCEAVEESGKIYMFAENYPYTKVTMEMARLYKAGEIGDVLYGEGEYIHPMSVDETLWYCPSLDHWRNNLPATYYCTHAMAPLMVATDTMPVSVNALVIEAPDGYRPHALRQGDIGSVILCRMNNGAVFRLVQHGIPGHSVWYRMHGSRGLIESTRGIGYWGPPTVRVSIDEWELAPGEVANRTYQPDFPKWAQAAAKAGHGGGDYFTSHFFAEAIRSGRQPYLNVYRGVAMSCVGILGWKSALKNGAPYAMPNFKSKRDRAKFADDQWSPFPGDEGPGQPPRSIRGHDKKIAAKELNYARKKWSEYGFVIKD